MSTSSLPDTRLNRRLAGFVAGVDCLLNRTISCHCRESNPDTSIVQKVLYVGILCVC